MDVLASSRATELSVPPFSLLVRRLLRLARLGKLPAEPFTELIEENRWIAQRYGVSAAFGQQNGEGGCLPILEELQEQLADDARALDCEAELRHVLTIARNGTCADRQLYLYHHRRQQGDSHQEALRHVVDLLLAQTREQVVEDAPGRQAATVPGQSAHGGVATG